MITIIQKFIPQIKIVNLRICNGYWEVQAIQKYPLSNPYKAWYKVSDLIADFK